MVTLQPGHLMLPQYLSAGTPAPVVHTGTPALHLRLASSDGLDHELSLGLEQVS